MSRRITLSLFAFIVVPSAALVAAGPSKGVPELKPLSHFAGEWDVAITSEGAPFTKGEAKSKWILGGRFLVANGVMQTPAGGPPVRFKTLRTYDPQAREYHSWTFMSDGGAMMATDKWDAEKKIMSSISKRGEYTTKTTADFSEDGKETWKIVTTDGSGAEIFTLSGVNTRKK